MKYALHLTPLPPTPKKSEIWNAAVLPKEGACCLIGLTAY